MKPSHILRIALEGDENLYSEEQKTETTEGEAIEETTPQSSEAERLEKIDASSSEKNPEGAEAIAADNAAPAAGVPDGGETTVVDTVTEEPQQKKLKKEDELVFYGKIVDFQELKKCKNIELHEQYEVKIPKSDKNATGGRIRVRKSVKGDKEPKFVLTTKTKLPDGSDYESDCKTTEENFIQFKYFCEGGMIKERYIFPVEGYKGLKWEVDVFTGTNGLLHEWVKIDLEREDQNIELANIPAFPIQLSNIITNQNGQRTPEEEAIVRTLYDTVFRTPNPIISKKS